MNILIVLSGGFDTHGPSRHLYHALISDLLSDGHTVHLIESHTSGTDSDAPDAFVSHPAFSYETISAPTVEKKAFVKRYTTGVKYCFGVRRLLKKHKNAFDCVMMQSCPWAPFMTTFLKRGVRAPLIWNVQDMYPGSAIANGVMKRKWMQRFFYAFQKIAYRKADHITVISEDMKKKVMEQGVPEEKLTVIVNWFDDRTVEEIPWEENRFVRKYSLDRNQFYVQYAGTMGFNFDYPMVIRTAEKLTDCPDIVFQMIGFGSRMADFENAVKEAGLTNIVFLPLQPQNTVADVYSACNVCFIPLPQGVIGNSVPSKAGLLMACKRAIVTTADTGSDYNRMINENGLGYAFGTDDPDAVADALRFLYEHPDKCRRMGENGYAYGSVLYARSVNTKKYISLFREIAGKK